MFLYARSMWMDQGGTPRWHTTMVQLITGLHMCVVWLELAVKASKGCSEGIKVGKFQNFLL